MENYILFALLMSCSLGAAQGKAPEVSSQVALEQEATMHIQSKKSGIETKGKVLATCVAVAAVAGITYVVLNKNSAADNKDNPFKDKNISGITLIQGDITQQVFHDPEHAAIVNAANPPMLGGAGIDGAIHRAAGPGLVAECRQVSTDANGQRCPVGQARITGGHNLAPVRIIHTVGPDTRIPAQHRARVNLLRNAYQNSLALANAQDIHVIALPSISTGIYGFNLNEATGIAVDAAIAHARNHPEDEIRFVAYNPAALQVYRDVLTARCALQEQVQIPGGASALYRFDVR